MLTKRFLMTPLLLLTALAALAPHAHAQENKAAFPVPRAEKEFVALLPGLHDYCGHVTKSDPKAFLVALSAYGPLDVQVRKAASPAEARDLRNFHLGVTAAMSEMPLELAKRLGQPFQSAPADVRKRKDRLVKELPQLEAFAQHFGAVPQITLLAHWGFRDEYRVNDTFHMMGQTSEAVPSAEVGFVPSGQWKPYRSFGAYLDSIHVTQATFDALHGQLQSLLVVAIRRTGNGSTGNGNTEIVGTGIANNASGLLFLQKGAAPPVVGERKPDGAKYSDVEQVKPGIVYFETN